MICQCQRKKQNLMVGQESAQTDGRTRGRMDGRTDRVIPIYPLNFIHGREEVKKTMNLILFGLYRVTVLRIG